MNSEQIVQMANRIAAFFAAMPEHAEAVDGVAGHLRKFWEPRLREQLGALIAGGDTAALHPLVLEAWERVAVRA